MDSPWPMILITISYVCFVFQFGPRFMKNRPAYDLKTFIRFFNIFQIVANAYLVKEILAVYSDAVAFRCLPIDYSDDPGAMRVCLLSIHYSRLSKYIYPNDTFDLFFITN